MKADADPEVAARDAAALARLLVEDGRPEEAHAALESVDETALGERALSRVLLARLVTLNFGLGRTDAADEVFAEARRRLRDPCLVAEFVAQHAYHLAMRGESRRVLDVLRTTPRTPPSAPPHPIAVAARAIALAHLGRCRQAAALCDAALGGDPGPPRMTSQARLALELARHTAGLLSGDAAWARVRLAGRLDGPDGPCGVARTLPGLCLAQAERIGGDVTRATRLLRATAAPLSGAHGSAVAGEFAHLAALRGDLAEAEGALVTAQRAVFPATRLTGFWLDLARPWVAALREGPVAGTAAALATAGRARAVGLHGFELLALHDVVRLAPPRSAPCHRAATRLAAIATAFEGDLAAVAAAHARAAARADPAALGAVSRDLERLGMPLHAAEAAAQAADILVTANRDVAARAASARAWYLSARCDGAHTPAVSRLREPRLTNRESQVARLAADGLTSKQIAARLTMSVRTVDNHLRAVYTKLGISGRAELAGIGLRRVR